MDSRKPLLWGMFSISAKDDATFQGGIHGKFAEDGDLVHCNLVYGFGFGFGFGARARVGYLALAFAFALRVAVLFMVS